MPHERRWRVSGVIRLEVSIDIDAEDDVEAMERAERLVLRERRRHGGIERPEAIGDTVVIRYWNEPFWESADIPDE